MNFCSGELEITPIQDGEQFFFEGGVVQAGDATGLFYRG